MKAPVPKHLRRAAGTASPADQPGGSAGATVLGSFSD
jgi:hypothetical protein